MNLRDQRTWSTKAVSVSNCSRGREPPDQRWRSIAPRSDAAIRMPIEATIFPPERVGRALPVNMRTGDEVLFEHELVRDVEATKSIVVKNVELLPNGFLSQGATVLFESFTSAPKGYLLLKRWFKMAAYRATARAVRYVERGLFATDEFSNGYFHWICDVLPRLEATCVSEISQRSFLVPAMAMFSYVPPSLGPYGFSEVCVTPWKERIRCADLMIVTQAAPTGNYRPSLMRSLRSRFRSHFGSGRAQRKLYISRARAERRRIRNEDEVADVLARHGYERIFLEDLSLQEQVQMVGSAKVLLGNHGAGLANMAWMLPGTTVLELRLQGDRQNNCYFSLASALDIQYRYLSCDAAERQNDAHVADLVVDSVELEKELSKITDGVRE